MVVVNRFNPPEADKSVAPGENSDLSGFKPGGNRMRIGNDPIGIKNV